MKVAILSESPADEAAIRILADAVLGIKTSPVSHVGLRERGWPSVRSVFPTVLKQLHYHGDAEGLIFVVDSNGAVVHQANHELPASPSLVAVSANCGASGMMLFPNCAPLRAKRNLKPPSDSPCPPLKLGYSAERMLM